MSEAISPQQADGTARRIEVIRQTASHGDPYEIRFTRYAAQLMLGEIDRMAKELAHYIQAESADAAAGSYALRAETAEAERDRLAARVAELEGERDEQRTIIHRVTAQMEEYGGHGIRMVNVRQVINLLSPTWPDGNYAAAPDRAEGNEQ